LGGVVRRCDIMLPYLVILVLESLGAALNNDKDITGVQIESSEFLLSQYADDSSLVLDDNSQSLEKKLFILCLFSKYCGLKVILDKADAV
jgi:hypothetical protein